MGYFSLFAKEHPNVETIGSSIDHPGDDHRSKRMSIRSTKFMPRSSIIPELNSRLDVIDRPNDLTRGSSTVSLSPAKPASNVVTADSRPLSTEPLRKVLVDKIKFRLGSRSAVTPSHIMPSIPQKKVRTSVYGSSDLIRGTVDRDEEKDQKEEVNIMASRLNQLSIANSNGLLGDEDYRLLRQMVFDECANTQSTSISDRATPTVEPARVPDTAVLSLPLDWKRNSTSYHERTSSLGSRYTKRGSRYSSSIRYSSMSIPEISDSETESPEEILSMIKSVESESYRMKEMFDQMESRVLAEAVENGWIAGQNLKDQTENHSVELKTRLDQPNMNSSHRTTQVKLRDIRERRRDVQNRYDLRLDLFRKKLRAAEIKANIMR